MKKTSPYEKRHLGEEALCRLFNENYQIIEQFTTKIFGMCSHYTVKSTGVRIMWEFSRISGVCGQIGLIWSLLLLLLLLVRRVMISSNGYTGMSMRRWVEPRCLLESSYCWICNNQNKFQQTYIAQFKPHQQITRFFVVVVSLVLMRVGTLTVHARTTYQTYAF